jgi:hypothetical protein
MRLNKRPMTMLETLIALSLAMLILSTLTFFYRQVATLNNQVDTMQKEGFRMRYVENRLAAVLPNAVSEKDEKKDFFFFSTSSTWAFAMQGSPTLFFTYDNGIRLDKVFSNHVIGRLFLDNQGRFCLASWPSPNRWVDGTDPPMKLEVLLEGVKELRFGFFVAPERDWQIGKETKTAAKGKAEPQKLPDVLNPPTVVVKPTPEGQWLSSWSYDYQQLPAIVSVGMTLKNNSELLFRFPLPKAQRQVVYKQ